jgi:hypothetical protein
VSPATPVIGVRKAVTSDALPLARFAAAACESLEISTWLAPTADQRLATLTAHFRVIIAHAVRHGVVHTVTGRAAVAVWRSSTVVDPLFDLPDADRLAQLRTTLRAARPALRTHTHLTLLAVRPTSQGNGLAHAVLDPHCHTLDLLRQPAYAEAVDPRGRQALLGHGFQDWGTPIVIPGFPGRVWPMWRSPLPPAPATPQARPPTPSSRRRPRSAGGTRL